MNNFDKDIVERGVGSMKKIKIFFILFVITIMFTFAVKADIAEAATGTKISTVEDLKKMEENPSGTYYLANDINVPENLQLFVNTAFTGTLDGNGHELKGYKYIADGWCNAGLFGKAKNAVFKNLDMTDVKIKVQSLKGAWIGALVVQSWDCTFDNIEVSGTITAKGRNGFLVGGIACYATGESIFKNCTSDLEISIKSKNFDSSSANRDIEAAGIAVASTSAKFSNCQNKGDIIVEGKPGGAATIAAVGIAMNADELISCKNTGYITVKVKGGESFVILTAAGLAGEGHHVKSCFNTGRIKATATKGGVSEVKVGGLIGEGSRKEKEAAEVVTQCYNTGKVTFSGDSKSGGTLVGGIAGMCTEIKLSYNKGTVYALAKTGMPSIGGLCGEVYEINNCYNTGTVQLEGSGLAGGLAARADIVDTLATSNYNTGSVTAKGKETYAGAIFATYEGADVVRKCNIYNNYYTNNIKAYATSYITWHEFVAKATKVSKITSANCSKLSSEHWTYSAKLGRMILKANPEQ